ncbi:probable methyltransferase TARBP1 [Mercenaria mercenaria]|uniref:probable methyltransferase TARBP1 n=1 Tax=Mercenaria mercenaria TaxID=6596 RepID=UPI00234E8C62|nr:probable methyltransferase TARBP1 [Mercenaria mercenaria]
MEKSTVIGTLFQQSSLKVEEVCHSLINSIQSNLDQGFKFEEISSYSHNLAVLKDLLCCNGAVENRKDAKQKGKDEDLQTNENLADIKLNIVEKICLPLLGHLFPSSDSRPEVQVLLGVTGQLVAVCVKNNDGTFHSVLEYIEMNIEKFENAKPTNFDMQHDRAIVDIHTILEVMRHVINSVAGVKNVDDQILARLKSIFTKLTESLEYISVELIGSASVPVLLKIMKVDCRNAPHYLDFIWKYIQNFSQLNDRRKQFLLLCGFANYFFPVNGEVKCVDIKQKEEFWEILQSGLYSKDSVNRKRSLYLLKRIVDICESTLTDVNTEAAQPIFWWSRDRSPELSKTWQDFMLLAEVLEEKQVHVIRPLLPRMKLLVKASEMPPGKGQPLLHTSWLKTILLRSSYHESLQIIRWSAETVLSLDLSKCPMIEQGLDQYLAGPMLYSLQEPKLYVRESGSPLGTMPAIAEKLVNFFTTCWDVMSPENKGSFFCRTVKNISSRHWGPIALLFICRGLARVPPTPCLDRNTVLELRKLLTGFLVAVDTYFRGTIQGYLVQILIKFTDKSTVLLEDFIQILCLVRREESLQRGTALWTQCVTWFEEGGPKKSEWDPEGMRQYIESSVTKYLQTSLDSKYSTADSAAAVMVARLLLLASDASIATELDDNNSSTLIKVTQMLATVLNSINTHAYMSTHKADKALLLLILLMKESKPKGEIQDDQVVKVIHSAVESCQSEILVYVGRQISDSIISVSDMSHLELYVDCVQVLAESASTMRSVQFDRLVDTCVAILNKPSEMMDLQNKLQHLSAVCILGTLSSFCHMIKHGNDINFTKPSGDQRLSQQEWGKISSLFLENEWQVVEMALQHSAAPWCDMLELLALAEDTLSVGVTTTSVIVLKCLRMIIPQVKDLVSGERLVSILGTCWFSFQEARRIVAFWDVLEAFVQAAFQPCLLQMAEDSPVIVCLTEYAEQLMETGKDKNGVVNALATQLCTVWSENGMMLQAGKFVTVIVDLCMFGALIRRGVRYEIIMPHFEEGGVYCFADVSRSVSLSVCRPIGFWMITQEFQYRESKNLTLCSLLCIVIHMGPHHPPDEQTEYFKQAIPNILPWCMAHHFHTRIYSQAVLAKLWDQCQQLGLHMILKENAILNCIVDFSQQNRNSTRNVKKLLDSFFFKFLDFERDFTLETIYKIVSKMTSLTEEDWIQPEQFIQNSSIWNDGAGSSYIQLRNISRGFEQCDPGLWKYISLKNPADDDAVDETVADDTESDVQKKIMPWRQMMLDEETMSEVDHGVKQHIEGGLVVVTSLINKIPNLGGLCRTSEIFGVSEYVMGKMGYKDDKAFQGLSVTAHKWIPITEVHETKLADYLQQKKQEGYTLVGVEQTANSVCLTEYTFPEKTLLLLGNEKEGIPVELISLLDVCVEIPQQGVIRSLNVHVSGAILIWEYRRQQLMKSCSS